MQFAFLFSYGMMAALLELHLDSFGLSQIYVSLVFICQSIFYLAISLTAGKIFRGFDERSLMLLGILSLCLSYIMVGPWSLIFPHELGLVIAAIPFMSFGQSLVYSKR
jgi:Na+/melibiose symporter-like transporter